MTSYLTIEQACQRYGISRNSLNSLFNDGAPVIQFGPKLLRIDVELFDTWIREHLLRAGESVGSDTSQGGSREIVFVNPDANKSLRYTK